jgi:hypothetical protein
MTHILYKAATGALLGISFIVASSDAAFAAPPAPAAGPTCSTSDIKVLLTGTAAPISCIGSTSGNDSNSATKNTLFGSSFTGNVNFNEFKLDNSEGTSAGSWFSIDENSTENGGTLTFLKNIDTVFSFVLKASDSYSSYLFDGVTAGKQFSFTTAGTAVNNKGKAQQLSHASLYFSNKAASTPTPVPTATPTPVPTATPIPVPPVPNTTPTEIPEPSTALGLLAFGAVVKIARRRQAK